MLIFYSFEVRVIKKKFYYDFYEMRKKNVGKMRLIQKKKKKKKKKKLKLVTAGEE